MQSKGVSLLEIILNQASGFFVSLAVWTFVIVPIWNIDVDFGDNLIVTTIFATVSIIRGYCWRRAFNYFTTRGRK